MVLPTDAMVLGQLTDDELHIRGYLTNASNHTLFVDVGDPESDLAAVYKPQAGERPLWDFPSGTLCHREVAAYEVSAALGWEIVPPTVLRDGPMGLGSVQMFVPHDPDAHYFTLVQDQATHRDLARMALFDLLVNNADRKASHVVQAADDGRIVGVDHGLTFHSEAKVRTVIWDLGPAPIERAWQRDLERLAADIDRGESICARLSDLLSPIEVGVLAARARALAGRDTLLVVPEDRRPYPWPPL